MQKVIRRTIMAEKQVLRRKARRKAELTRMANRNLREQAEYARRQEIKLLKEARVARREDWEMGPLAPRRDVGDKKDTYGTISPQSMNRPELRKEERDAILKPWGGRFLNITEGDRVVLLEGRDKGKIGKVISIDKDRAQVTVEGLNLADVAVPQWMIDAEEADKRKIRTVETGISLASVRLVFPLKNEETGETRDVIIKRIVSGNIWADRQARTAKWSRFIDGLNIKIPWPKREPKVFEDQPSDTLRLDVEVKSFVPTLLRPPMPSSVIDELRNKYSIFRTRHDPEYIEKKMAEDREIEERKKMSKKMVSPLREANRKARKERRKLGRGKLTPEMLEKLGQHIAQKRDVSLDMAGLSISKEVSPDPEPLMAS